MDYLWNAVKSLEYNARYISYYKERANTIKIIVNTITAILSSGSFAALACWDALPWLFSALTFVSVVVQIAYQNSRVYQLLPYLPLLEKRLYALSSKAKKEFVKHCDDNEKHGRKIAMEFYEEFIQIENELLGGEFHIPTIKSVEKKAETETAMVIKEEFCIEDKE